MSLLLGRFTYRNLGLLDNTHLRFFTRENLRGLLTDAGFVAIEVRSTTAPLFGTELGVRPDEVSPDVVALISADPDAVVYQFVLTAVPRDATTLAAEAAWQAQQQRARLAVVESELAALGERFAQLKADLNAAQEVNVQLQSRADALAERAETAELAQRELDALLATRTLRTRSATLRMMGRA
jgi:hypothetical protein